MDPALSEALRTRGPEEELEAIVRLRPGATAPPAVRIVASFGTISTCRIAASQVQVVHDDAAVATLKGPRVMPRQTTDADADLESALPSFDERLSRPRLPGLDGDWSGRGVVVAFLDWGLDFQAASFRHASDGRTRLLGLWDQRGPAPDPGNRYGYGRIFDPDTINRALASANPREQLGYYAADADQGNGAHASHVADIAVGNGRTPGTIPGLAPDADLIFVNLATSEGPGHTDLCDSVRVLEALDFVRLTAGARPWVVNMSLGQTAGEHAGQSLVERAMDALLEEAPGRLAVVSAGNYFLRETHAEGRVRPGHVETLSWIIADDDPTANELEVWYSGRDRFELIIRPPDGIETRVPLGQRRELVAGGRPVARAYHRFDRNNGDNHIDIFVDARAPGGVWSIELAPTDVVDGRFHSWIQRDNPRFQSRFDSGQASPRSTIGTLASSHRALAVGAYDPWALEEPIAPFSSSGPDRYGRTRPDLLGPGVGIVALRSAPRVEPADWLRVTSMSGTSMAAPHITGAAARLFQAAGRPLPIAITRRLLLGTCAEHTNDDPLRSGCGRIDIAAALAELARMAASHETEEANMSTTESATESTMESSIEAFSEPRSEPAVEIATQPLVGGGFAPAGGGFAEDEPPLPPRSPRLDAGQIAIHVRSFAPFSHFGGGFAGDSRGFSTSASATSRINHYVVLDLRRGREGATAVWSDLSHGPFNTSARSRPRANTVSRFGDHQARYWVHLSGANPLVPGAPDIDVSAQLDITWSDDRASLACVLTGDGFPNAEVFVEDPAGQRVFVAAFATRGNGSATDAPLRLSGNWLRPMGEGQVTILTGASGRFTGIAAGNSPITGIVSRPMPIAAWNAQFEARGTAPEWEEAFSASAPAWTEGWLRTPQWDEPPATAAPAAAPSWLRSPQWDEPTPASTARDGSWLRAPQWDERPPTIAPAPAPARALAPAPVDPAYRRVVSAGLQEAAAYLETIHTSGWEAPPVVDSLGGGEESSDYGEDVPKAKGVVELGQGTTITIRRVSLGKLYWERRYKGDLFGFTDTNGDVVTGGPRPGWRAMALGNLYGRRALAAIYDLDQLERRWRTHFDRVKQGFADGQELAKKTERSMAAISERSAKEPQFGMAVHNFLEGFEALPTLALEIEEADEMFGASLNRLKSWLKQGDIDKTADYLLMKEADKAEVLADIAAAKAILDKVLSIGGQIVGVGAAPGAASVVGLVSEGVKELGGAIIEGFYAERLGALEAALAATKERLAGLRNAKYKDDLNAAQAELAGARKRCEVAAKNFTKGVKALDYARATALNIATSPSTRIISDVINLRAQQFQNIARLRTASEGFLKLQDGLVGSLAKLTDHYLHIGDWIDDIAAPDPRLARNSAWASANELSAYSNSTKLGEWKAYVPFAREACQNAHKAVEGDGPAKALRPYDQAMSMVEKALATPSARAR